MRNVLIVAACILCPLFSGAQQADARDTVVAAIKTLFDGMRAGDTTAMRKVIHPDARLQTTFIDKDGKPRISGASIDKWLSSVGTPHDAVFDEKIWSYDVRIDQNLATVWTEYTFYLGDKLSHCGVNAFQLFRNAEGWKIIQVTDTRRKEGCLTPKSDLRAELNNLVDNWHIAAATADENAFFGSMTADGVYIGTDASERWLRDELREWAKSAFERETAWDFKPSDRHIAIGADGRTAWWDEKLDTWMGICRASGVLVNTPAGWKIQHYQLSVTVPNEKIKPFIELVKK